MAGRNAVLVDDFTLAMGTLAEAADRLMAAGAVSVMAAVTHGVFAECSCSMERLDASPIDKLLFPDTVETRESTSRPRHQEQPQAPFGPTRLRSKSSHVRRERRRQ